MSLSNGSNELLVGEHLEALLAEQGSKDSISRNERTRERAVIDPARSAGRASRLQDGFGASGLEGNCQGGLGARDILWSHVFAAAIHYLGLAFQDRKTVSAPNFSGGSRGRQAAKNFRTNGNRSPAFEEGG